MSDKMSYLAVLIALLPAALAAQGVRSGGNGTIYMGAYNEAVYVIDEATLEVSERIPVTTGIPNLMQLSPDNRTLYVRDAAMEHIEVVDLAEGRSIDSFTLSEGNTKVRIRSMAVDPGGEYILLGARSYTKLLDRFEIGDFAILRVDLDSHEVTDTVPTSVGEQRQGANLMFSPDGDLLYFFGRDIIAVETENFTEVDRWELSQPLEEGLGRMNMSFQRSPYDDEGIFTNLFRMTDPVQGRQMMGIARVNLAEQDVDFYTLGPERAGELLAGAGRAQGVRAALGDRLLRVLDLRSGGAAGREPGRVPRASPHVAGAELQRRTAVHLQRRQHHRRLRRRDPRAVAHGVARRRHDALPAGARGRSHQRRFPGIDLLPLRGP